MDFFSDTGPLAGHLPHFEVREGQQKMAEAIEHTLNERNEDDPLLANILMVEAETGIGKTLAYLVPALNSTKRVVVSTATINLQDQIVKKDIPLLEKVYGDELPVLCVKGRQNYLCQYRWLQYCSSPQGSLFHDEQIEKIEEWLKTTETGDRAELDWLADNSPLWQKIAAHGNQCYGADCPENSYCFITKLRRKAAKAKLLIVNHHLLFSDLGLKSGGYGEVLPRYEVVVFDEAHHVENVASTFFGKSFSQYQLLDLITDVSQQAEADLDPESIDTLLAELAGLKQRVEHFTAIFPEKTGRFPLTQVKEQLGENFDTAVFDISSSLVRLADRLKKLSVFGEIWAALGERAKNLDMSLHETSLVTEGVDSLEGYVHWYERRKKSIVLSATPIDVSKELDRNLYHGVEACIFTSATLSTGGSFSYISGRLGLPDSTRYLQLSSPFNYRERTRLYVPDDFCEPSNQGYQQMAAERIEKILQLSRGRALILFTSFRAMDMVAEYLEDRLEYPLLVQGQLPRNVLLEQFRSKTDSVLLAVASFWEGVDVSGESLSCVVIDKLPFEVPTDPVFKARVDAITEQGGKPFFEYQVPRAILSLRQGAGRLMRSSGDSGLITILDVRLFSKGYGRNFLKSLPPSPVVRTLKQVEEFYTVQN